MHKKRGDGLMEKRISIIMGIYNCANTLSAAIESILNQSYPGWKLIMCDDGSTDETYRVAEHYQKLYPERMILIQNKKNMGLNYTLNCCLQYVDTEYVARMDGDDISVPSRLEKEIAFLDSHPEYAIVSSPTIYFDENGEIGRGKRCGEPSIYSFSKRTPFCHPVCMVRAEAYRTVGGYLVSTKRLRVEDWDLWIRMYEAGYRGYNLEEPLYKLRDDRKAYGRRKFRYRINEARVSASAVKKLGLPKIYYAWLIRPIIVGLLPKKLYEVMHKRRIRGVL